MQKNAKWQTDSVGTYKKFNCYDRYNVAVISSFYFQYCSWLVFISSYKSCRFQIKLLPIFKFMAQSFCGTKQSPLFSSNQIIFLFVSNFFFFSYKKVIFHLLSSQKFFYFRQTSFFHPLKCDQNVLFIFYFYLARKYR